MGVISGTLAAILWSWSKEGQQNNWDTNLRNYYYSITLPIVELPTFSKGYLLCEMRKWMDGRIRVVGSQSILSGLSHLLVLFNTGFLYLVLCLKKLYRTFKFAISYILNWDTPHNVTGKSVKVLNQNTPVGAGRKRNYSEFQKEWSEEGIWRHIKIGFRPVTAAHPMWEIYVFLSVLVV